MLVEEDSFINLNFFSLAMKMKRGVILFFAVLLVLPLVSAELSCTAYSGNPILASDGWAGDGLGNAAAMSGDVAVVGAMFRNQGGLGAGVAYVWRFDGSNWVMQKLEAPDRAAYNLFGSSVAISNDLIIVGAPNYVSGPGSAYIFRYSGGIWVMEQKIVALDGANLDKFGSGVGISGNVAIVGAKADDTTSTDSGSAYVFRYNGASWVQEQKLAPSQAISPHEFGAAVAVSGNTVVVGSAQEIKEVGCIISCGYFGATYVYRFDGSNWVQEARLTQADRSENDFFGNAVAVDGDIVLVGSYKDSDAGLGAFAGAAYIFRKSGSNWIQEAKLITQDVGYQSNFGSSVSLADGLAVVGAFWDTNEGGTNAGSAYVFAEDSPGQWVQQKRLVATSAFNSDKFGASGATSMG